MKWEIIKEADPPFFEDEIYRCWRTPNIFNDNIRVYMEEKSADNTENKLT